MLLTRNWSWKRSIGVSFATETFLLPTIISPPPGKACLPKSKPEYWFVELTESAPSSACLLISPWSSFTATPRPRTEAAICRTLKKSRIVGIRTKALSTVPDCESKGVKNLSNFLIFTISECCSYYPASSLKCSRAEVVQLSRFQLLIQLSLELLEPNLEHLHAQILLRTKKYFSSDLFWPVYWIQLRWNCP